MNPSVTEWPIKLSVQSSKQTHSSLTLNFSLTHAFCFQLIGNKMRAWVCVCVCVCERERESQIHGIGITLNILIFLFSQVLLQQPNYYPHSFHHILLYMCCYDHLFWVHEPLLWYLLQLGRQQSSTFIIWAIFGYTRHHIANLMMIHIKMEIFC